MKTKIQYILWTILCHFSTQVDLMKAKVKWIICHLGDKSNLLRINGSSVVKCKFGIQGKDNVVEVKNGASIVYTSVQIDGNGNKVILDGCRGILNITLRGENCTIYIHKNSSFEDAYMVCMGAGNSITIGESCMFSGKVEFWNSDTHLITNLEGHPLNPSKPIFIGNHIWGGKHSKVLKGVTIGDNSVIGMGAIVTHDVPANSIVAGNPAKVVKTGVTWHHGFIEI